MNINIKEKINTKISVRMSNVNYRKIFAMITSFVLFMPLFLFAQPGPTGGLTIQNPLGAGNTSVQAILLKIMNIVTLVGGIVVVFFIIYSGFKFVTAGDSDSDRTKAKNIFYSTIIGAAILLGADIIANVVMGTVKAIK